MTQMSVVPSYFQSADDFGGGHGCRPGTEREAAVLSRAVVKSTFVESKTSPSPKRFESKSRPSPSQDRVQRGSSPSQVQVQMRRSKQRKKKKIFFKTTYLIIDNLFDRRDGISSILI